jgi:histidinol-phosphate phosphatase family protein
LVEQAVVLCGGKGTRLGRLVADIPKPMLAIQGRPVLDYAIDRLRGAGVTDIVLAAGYKADVIRAHYAVPPPGLRIRVYDEPSPLGTAGCVRELLPVLAERFVVLYGDVFVDFDIGELVRAHRPDDMATILVRASDHPWDSDLIEVDADNRIVGFLPAGTARNFPRNIANAAVYVVDRKLVELRHSGMVADWIRDVFPAALGVGMTIRAHTFTGDGFLRDMGTPARLERVERYLEDKQLISRARSKRLPVTTVFLDRDGVINQDTDLLHSPDDFRLLPGVGEAVARLNRAGLTVVVVTNQPVIARGLCTEHTLGLIHDRMARLLAEYHAHVDAIYFCPHHPETHHRDEGSRRDLRVACDCRKPAPGLLLQAARERDIDLAGSVLIGDRPTDIAAAKRAGVRSILLGTGSSSPSPDYRFATLPDAVSAILAGGIE